MVVVVADHYMHMGIEFLCMKNAAAPLGMLSDAELFACLIFLVSHVLFVICFIIGHYSMIILFH